MTRTATKYPIESFGPEIMAALTKGSQEEYSITLPSYRDAVRFQQRIHMLRKRMREEQHPLYTVAARVHISLAWGIDAGFPEVATTVIGKGNRVPVDRSAKTKVTLKPRDSEFTAALLEAGISKEELKDDPLQEMSGDAPATSPTSGAIDSLFGIETEKEK